MQTPERFDTLQLFLAAADANSFAAAALRLNLSRSAVAKAVARLERRRQLTLFHRGPRGHTLTDEGRYYREQCLQALHTIEAAETQLRDRRNEPAGRVRLSLPPQFGRLRVLPALTRLGAAWPALEFDLRFTARPVDLAADAVDLAMRIGELPVRADLIARKLGTQRLVLCAAPAYLDAYGKPSRREQLAAHRYIAHAAGPWRFGQANTTWAHPTPHWRLDDMSAVLQAAVAGAGIAQLPAWLAADALAAGTLHSILPALCPPGLPIHLLRLARQTVPPRLRVTIEAIVMACQTKLG